MSENPIKIKPKQEEVNYKRLLMHYLVHWKWIVLSTFLFAGISYLYLKSQIDIFQSEARVLVKDNQKGGDAMQMDVFSDLGIGTSNVNVYNEIEAFTTRSIIKEVIKDLGIQESVRKETGWLEKDQLFYDNRPFYTNLSNKEKHQLNRNINFRLQFNTSGEFSIIQEESGGTIQKELGVYGFNEEVKTAIGTIKFLKNTSVKFKPEQNDAFLVSLSTLDGKVSELKQRLSVSLLSKEASIISVKCKGPISFENNAIINSLIQQHEERVIKNKNEIAVNTSEFINERMKLIESELSGVEDQGENFKTENKLINVESDATALLKKEGEIEKLITELSVQIMLVQYVNDFLEQSDEINVLLPANLGFEDGSVSSLIGDYNTLVLERNRLAAVSSPKNPMVVQMQNQIDAVRKNLKESLLKSQTRLEMKLEVFKKQNQTLKKELASIPGYEREYREILRQQEIKEALYIYLLEKREENEIAMASTIGTVNVMDEAYAHGGPISPKKMSFFAGAVGIGFILPILIIYLKGLLDTKIKSAEELEKLGIPYIGEIPFYEGSDQLIAVKGERSPTGEALRMLRVNMNFMLPDNNGKAKTIFVTSTIAGEGKTFTAINLASSIGLMDKKVILFSLDLRKPKVSKYLGLKDLQGVTDYIVNEDIALESIIQTLPKNPNMDIILSGSIPPNPSELLTSKRVTDLFTTLQDRYDYVIVDTAPVGLVSDVLTIMHQADLLLYVVRFGKLEKEALKIPKNLSEESKVKRMATVLNGTKKTASGYGGYGYGYSYGYGYGYGYDSKDKRSWSEKLFNKK